MAKTVGQLRVFDTVYRPTIDDIDESTVVLVEAKENGITVELHNISGSSNCVAFIAKEFNTRYNGVMYVNKEDAELAQRNMRLKKRERLLKDLSEASMKLIEFTEKYF